MANIITMDCELLLIIGILKNLKILKLKWITKIKNKLVHYRE